MTVLYTYWDTISDIVIIYSIVFLIQAIRNVIFELNLNKKLAYSPLQGLRGVS